MSYLSDCDRHRQFLSSMKMELVGYDKLPRFRPPPASKWYLATYVRDVWARLSLLKACATSVYGSILKIDSTKKITCKLQGTAAGSASWCTNVGNQRGDILVSVLTTSESPDHLKEMADGFMKRYSEACQEPPRVLYTDRDCCSLTPPSKYEKLFDQWEVLVIRLDSLRFMRRLARACTNESHPLYATFMGKISGSIFEWDANDMALLRKAKRAELQLSGVKNPSEKAVNSAVSKSEIMSHCWRRTRRTETTIRLIEELR